MIETKCFGSVGLFLCFQLWTHRFTLKDVGWKTSALLFVQFIFCVWAGQQTADPRDRREADYHKQFECYWFHLLRAVIEHGGQRPNFNPSAPVLFTSTVLFIPFPCFSHFQIFPSPLYCSCELFVPMFTLCVELQASLSVSDRGLREMKEAPIANQLTGFN